MSTSRSMAPLSVVMNRLMEKGYGSEFQIDKEGAFLTGTSHRYKPSELKIVKIYRFEGESDPGDMSVLYAVETTDGKKGMLVNAYGTYSDQDEPFYDEFIVGVPIEEREEMEIDEPPADV